MNEKIKQHLLTMEPFTENSDINVPVVYNKEDYKEYVVKNFIR